MGKKLSRLAARYYKLAKLTKLDINKKIIDCACGRGFGSALILEKFKPKKLLCIDLDKQQLKKCKEKTEHKVDYLCKDLRNFKSNEEFDYFFCLETLEHLPKEDNLKIASIISNLIKIEGKLLVSVPGNEEEERRVKNPLHLQFVSKKTLIDMFDNFILEKEDKFIKREKEPDSYNSLYVFIKKGDF